MTVDKLLPLKKYIYIYHVNINNWSSSSIESVLGYPTINIRISNWGLHHTNILLKVVIWALKAVGAKNTPSVSLLMSIYHPFV